MNKLEAADIPSRPETRALAARAGSIGWRHYWAALPKPLRVAFVEHYLSADPADRSRRRRWFAAGITAKGAGFTPASLMGRTDAEMAREASRINHFRDELVFNVVVAFFIGAHLDPQRALFGAAGVALNERGLPVDDEWRSPSEAGIAEAVAAVLATDRELSWLYLIAVSIGFDTRWPGLAAALRSYAAASTAEVVAGPRPPSADAPSAPPAVEPDTQIDEDAAVQEVESRRLELKAEPRLTILDDLLTKTILAAEAGHEHALSRDELNHLLDEVVRLDTERRRTAFHLGFADGLYDEAWRERLPQHSDERAAWYAAGYLLARRRKPNGAESFDDWGHPSVRLLLSRPWPPLNAVSGTILELLVAGQRVEELATCSWVLLDTNPLGALRAALEIGTRCLRENEPDRAYSVLAPAADWYALREPSLQNDGNQSVHQVGRDVRRRYAHSCRLSGRRQDAEQELHELCAQSALEPETQAMLLTDLGLLQGGYQKLADLSIPDQRSGFPDASAQLGRGREFFEQAAEASPTGAAHAKYALGILAALSGDWPMAAAHLRTAVGAFESRPSVYVMGGLLERARSYEAIAEILTLENAESSRAASQRLRRALEAGVRMPRGLISDVALALLTADAAIGAPFLQYLSETRSLPPEGIAELFVGSQPEVRRALVEVCAQLTDLETLSLEIRVGLAYKALESDDGTLPAGIREDLRALMEDAACDGVRLDDYLAFVSQHRPGWGHWTRSDAAIAAAHVCLANGRLEEAQEHARQAFNRLLAHQDRTADHDPEGALDLLRRAGAGADEIAAMEQRLGATAQQDSAAAVTKPMSSVRILIVGGDETQAQYESAIKAEVQSRYDGAVTVVMHPTGMGSNWNKHLEAVQRMLGSTDGVVISRYVRTMFGRRLRASLGNRPWRTCTSTGKAGFLRLVDDLVREIDAGWRATVGAES